MDARIDHCTDSRDARPAFGITYRRYVDTSSSHVRIQADNVDHAMQALTEYIGNTQYAVTSIRQEVPQVPAIAPVAEDADSASEKVASGIDWTTVVNFDDQGTFRGSESIGQAEVDLDELCTNGATVNEWHVKDRKGLIIRVVQVVDPEFGETVRVFPAECDDCGSPVTQLAWISGQHHAKCPRRDPKPWPRTGGRPASTPYPALRSRR